MKAAWPALQRAHLWLQYQDSNECGLLEAHEAMDWADLFANRYNSLGPNALWYAAHRAMAHLAHAVGLATEAEAYEASAEDVKFKINLLLWVGSEVKRDLGWVAEHRTEWLYPLQRTEVELQQRPYYLPYVAFRDFADRFDTFGNLLAILFGIAPPAQTERILDFINMAGLAAPWPIRVVYPVVHPGDKDWREYYRVRNLNLPDQYHNGGAWPFVGGFYVAALVKAGRRAEAAVVLNRLAEMNEQSADGGTRARCSRAASRWRPGATSATGSRAALRVGRVPLLELIPPGTAALAARAGQVAAGVNAILLANHGQVTWAADLDAAVDLAEELEQTARIWLMTGGKARTLGDTELAALARR